MTSYLLSLRIFMAVVVDEEVDDEHNAVFKKRVLVLLSAWLGLKVKMSWGSEGFPH